ncbi:helix-turn-helix domain-containing protein [Georgenia halophila]|uniref:Helix-turn-helix domain-containing protein n=1 Tax=Georgenia halophila TaxID=620889 RepID=A0ABP8LN61_9MICO
MSDHEPAWEFVQAPPRSAPGASSMVGYRAHALPDALHRGLPSSRLTFIVALDDGVEAAATEPALASVHPAPIILGGLHTTASYVHQRPAQAGVQLAMHPLAARAVFGIRAAELSVTEFDGTSFLGRWGTRLHERLTDAQDLRQAFRLVADELVRRYDPDVRDRLRPEVAHAWHLLERSRGTLPVASVARTVGLTPRHLGTLFHRELGRSPKAVAGLMRFEHATKRIANQIRTHGHADLAGVAADTGFSDQAHLSREFARYAGISPLGWVAEEFRNLEDGGHRAASGWAHE